MNRNNASYSQMLSFGVLMLAAIIQFGLLPLLLGNDSAIVAALPGWLPLPIALVALLVLEFRRVQRQQTGRMVRFYRCQSCNYAWDSSGD